MLLCENRLDPPRWQDHCGRQQRGRRLNSFATEILIKRVGQRALR